MIVKALNRLTRVARRYAATGRLRAPPGPIIERFFGGKDCFFVQVGANDGVCADPLHALIKANPRWRGIFIEPQEECFSQLRANYGSESRFAFEQIAIADTAGERPLYSLSSDGIRETGVPASFNGFASLSRDYFLNELTSAMRIYESRVTKEPAAYILETPVRCEPLMSVLSRHAVDSFDVFSIDAESYDLRVIRQLDLTRFRPKLILYEHSSLSANDQLSARSLLVEIGYLVVDCGPRKTMAVRRAPSRHQGKLR